MKVLFHCHTIASRCSDLEENNLRDFLDKNEFGAVFITDHNKITSFDWPKGKSILGSEIATKKGDVIGIFINEEIPARLSIKETAELIKKQGGLVVAPHPADIFRKEAMGLFQFIKNINRFDIVEIYNSRNIFFVSNFLAYVIAKIFNKPVIYGSDAHTISELNNVVFEIDDFESPLDFLQKLSSAKSWKLKRASLIVHLETIRRKKLRNKQN